MNRLVRQLPSSLEDVFKAAARFIPASSRPETEDPVAQQRAVQTQLILGPDRWRHLLVDQLPSWVSPVGIPVRSFPISAGTSNLVGRVCSCLPLPVESAVPAGRRALLH